MDILTGQATIGGTLSNIVNAIPGIGTIGGVLADVGGGAIDSIGGLFKGGMGGIANKLGLKSLPEWLLNPLGTISSIFGFKKHSPFTVWKGQAGTMPGAMPGSGDAFSIRFPELDSEAISKKVTDAGASVAANSNGGGITIQQLIVQRASEDPEEIQKTIKTGLVDLARELGV